MDFKNYYRALPRAEREAFADRAGTTTTYVEIHLLARPEARKIPRPKLMAGLIAASDGNCSESEVLSHFYSLAI